MTPFIQFESDLLSAEWVKNTAKMKKTKEPNTA